MAFPCILRQVLAAIAANNSYALKLPLFEIHAGRHNSDLLCAISAWQCALGSLPQEQLSCHMLICVTIDRAPHGSYFAGQVLARLLSHDKGVRRRFPTGASRRKSHTMGVSRVALPILLPWWHGVGGTWLQCRPLGLLIVLKSNCWTIFLGKFVSKALLPQFSYCFSLILVHSSY